MGNSHLLLCSCLLLLCCGVWSVEKQEEEFFEELLLRSLPDRKVLSHFHFTHRLPPLKSYGRHHRLFPKAIFQLVQKFRIQEMEISFTQGRWNYDRWGSMDPLASSNSKPSGVELWATFDVPESHIDPTWRNLTHALSGLFCASINFLESPTSVAAPVCSFRPWCRPIEVNSQHASCFAPPSVRRSNVQVGKEVSGHMRYGALPREAVCTENLTPWLKLLPCRDKAGLAILLDRPTIYRGFYHSLRLHVRSGDFDSRFEGTTLQQSLTLVMEPSKTGKLNEWISGTNASKVQPSWSLSSLFGRDLIGGCPVAKSSTVYLEFESSLVHKLLRLSGVGNQQGDDDFHRTAKDEALKAGVDGTWEGLEESQDMFTRDGTSELEFSFIDNKIYTLGTAPQRILHGVIRPGIIGRGTGYSILLEFLLSNSSDTLPLNVGISWKAPVQWTPLRGPFSVNRFLAGSGNARGTIAMTFKANYQQLEEHGSDVADGIQVMIFQLVPWYVRLYFHTLQIIVDERPRPLLEVVKWMQVFPSEDRKSPGVIEMELKLPSNSSMIVLTINFDKGFLRIDEHPPDANRGFDLPAALISFPQLQTEKQYGRSLFSLDTVSPLLKDFMEDKSVQQYTEVLLVPLATPDFSMPYNVITLTCTVLALYFGSLLNVLRRRVGEEERLARSRDSSVVGKLKHLVNKFHNRLTGRKEDSPPPKSLKLIKFVFVVVIAIIVKYYMDQ